MAKALRGFLAGRNRGRSTFIATVVITAATYAVLGSALSSSLPERLPATVARVLPAVPLVTALINASALGCLQFGWQAIRAGKVRRHRRLMLASAILISMFLLLYVTRVVLGGVKEFHGPSEIRRYIYLPVLTVHIALSIVSVPLVVYNLLTGLTNAPVAVARTSHPRVGRVAVILWSLSLTLGVVVYFLLNVLY